MKNFHKNATKSFFCMRFLRDYSLSYRMLPHEEPTNGNNAGGGGASVCGRGCVAWGLSVLDN